MEAFAVAAVPTMTRRDGTLTLEAFAIANHCFDHAKERIFVPQTSLFPKHVRAICNENDYRHNGRGVFVARGKSFLSFFFGGKDGKSISIL
jgi:hypothetical protein